MLRSKRLGPVQKITGEHEKKAVTQLGESRRTHSEQEARLKELQSFRLDYRKRLHESAQAGLDAGQMLDYRRFLNRLDEAVKQQEQLVHSCNQDVERKVTEWTHRRTRSKVLDKVVSRYHSEELHQDRRREQKEMDEHAMRQFKKPV